MKVGIVYTGTTSELEEDVERELKNRLGEAVELYVQKDPSIIKEINSEGYVTRQAAKRLVEMYLKAIGADCDAILNACSSVGEVADACCGLASYLGVPIVRIDELMCREAIKRGERIGIMGTLPTTMDPTRRTVERLAREMGRRVQIVNILVEGAFGLDQAAFRKRLSDAVDKADKPVDVFILAQGSMAYAAGDLSERYHLPFLGSPYYGAIAMKEALKNKGIIS